MIVLPAIVFLAALALVVIFETIHAYVEREWDTPLEKDQWAIIYWILIVVVLVCCRIMPFTPPAMFYWTPFDVIALIHMGICVQGGSFERRHTPQSPGQSGAAPLPHEHAEPENRKIRHVNVQSYPENDGD